MPQPFYQGRTYNHLDFVMVDATDFATPESALSAAIKIKVYGKLQSASNVHFITSGTGSLTTDIKHIGASVLGFYTIALAKADLSDASAAWYDQYEVALSATGAAYQVFTVEGVLSKNNISNLSGAVSDMQSYLVVMSGVLSDAYSGVVALSDAVSNAYSAAVVGSSRILLVQSRLSDLDSRLVSDLSDILSQALLATSAASDAASAAVQANSRVLLVQSRLSDLDSRLVSDLSDVLSQLTVVQSMASDAASAAGQGNSRVLLVQSRLSDFDSRMVSDVSDIRSMLTALSDAISDAHSDLGSKIGGITVSISASDVSDIASAVVAGLPIASVVSDIYSMLSDLYSDFQSRVPKRVATDSQLSDLASDLRSVVVIGNSRVLLVQSRLSDLDSRLVSDLSDVLSQLTVVQSLASDAASAAQQGNSRVLVAQSMISDVDSALTSQFVANSATLSDIDSALTSQLAIASSSFSDILSAANRIIGELPTNFSLFAIDTAGNARLRNLDMRLMSAGLVRDTSTTTQVILATSASATDDEYIGYELVLYTFSTTSPLASRRIIDYDGTTKVATLDRALNFTPVNATHAYSVFGNGVINEVGVRSAVGLAAANLDTQLGAIPTRVEATADKDEILAQLPAAPVKNASFTYVIKMVDSTDHATPETGLTIAMTRSLDGAAFGAATGVVTEISTGHYKVVASAADMNGDVVTHRFTSTGADDLTIEFKTVS